MLSKILPSYSPYYFALWRIIFGAYLTFYTLTLLPYVLSLYSEIGIYSTQVFPSFFPSLLFLNASPQLVIFLAIVTVFCSIAITIGWSRPSAAFVLWYISASFFNWNFFTEDPSVQFVGLLLILLVFIPTGEPFSFRRRKKVKQIEMAPWEMPYFLYTTALLALGFGYTISGYDKFQSEGWSTGDAMAYMYTLGITYEYWLLDLLRLQSPLLIMINTYVVAVLQFITLPFLLLSNTRFLMWLVVTGMFLFALMIFNIMQVLFGVLLFHFFLFDQSWIKGKTVDTVLFWYDTRSGLCQGYVDFIKTEDRINKTSFFSISFYEQQNFNQNETIILQIDGRKYYKSDAILEHWVILGGMWRVFAMMGKVIPKFIRNKIYDFAGTHLCHWFGRRDCG